MMTKLFIRYRKKDDFIIISDNNYQKIYEGPAVGANEAIDNYYDNLFKTFPELLKRECKHFKHLVNKTIEINSEE